MSTATETVKTEHSPLPWRTTKNDHRPMVAAADQTRVADCGIARGMARSEIEANAEFIVRAVNANEALVEACKGVSLMLRTELREYENEPWAQRVRAALELAEGKQ